MCPCCIYFISFGLDQTVQAMTEKDSAELGSAVRRDKSTYTLFASPKPTADAPRESSDTVARFVTNST